MNKTVNINLVGMVFHIDEDAFEILNNYLNALKNHFKKEEGSEEIINDIEGRIAELFTERLDKRESVTITDVKGIISIMGNPSQYDDEIEEQETSENQNKEEDLRKGKRRKVFRDEEERMIGGVCRGMSHYFDINVLFCRIIFIGILFLIGPGAPFLYIMFWIALPSAKTTAEKLEMKGEKVNINNIEKNIKDELDILTEKVKDFNKKTTQKYGSKARNFLQKTTDLFISIFQWTFKAIGSCFGIFVICIGILFFVIVSSVILSEGGMETLFNKDAGLYRFIFEDTSIGSTFSTGMLLFIGVPVVALVLLGLRLLFGTKIHSNYKIGMLVLWIAGWVLLGSASILTSKEFQQHARVTKVNNIDIESDTLYINANVLNRSFKISYDMFRIKMSHIDSTIIAVSTELNIIKSNDEQIKLITKGKSHSSTKKQAKEIASNILYNYTVTDNEINLDDHFYIPKGGKIRMQELNVTLEIPVGKTIFMDYSLENMIFDIKNVSYTYDDDMLGHYWKMEKEGLSCTSCENE
tara:strand:- start:93 stop:1664 length:1572 start_codon:yes stop_codon:yes gene_type:complete